MGLIITLLVLGLLLIIAEMTVIPGFGITGILGPVSYTHLTLPTIYSV